MAKSIYPNSVDVRYPNMHNVGMNTNILNPLRKELHANRHRWEQIAGFSGVPVSTIIKVAMGYTPNPRVKTCENLAKAINRVKTVRPKSAAAQP